jgi:hypothetical protein
MAGPTGKADGLLDDIARSCSTSAFDQQSEDRTLVEKVSNRQILDRRAQRWPELVGILDKVLSNSHEEERNQKRCPSARAKVTTARSTSRHLRPFFWPLCCGSRTQQICKALLAAHRGRHQSRQDRSASMSHELRTPLLPSSPRRSDPQRC